MHPKTEKLLAEARNTIRSGGWTPDGRIPSARELAGQWVISKELANKMIRMLADEELVEKDPAGYRYYIAGKAPLGSYTPQSFFAGSTPEWIAGRVRESIIDGTYGAEIPLPSLRDLMGLYNCSYATASCAYAILAEESMIERRGQRWHIQLVAPRRASVGARVYLIDNSRRPYGIMQNGIFHGVEQALARWCWPGLMRSFLGDPLPRSFETGGIIVTHNQIHGARWNQLAGVPCIFIDPTGLEIPPPCWPSRYYRLVPDHFEAGVAVGKYLGAKGHTRIALVSQKSLSQKWAKERLEGVRKGLKITAGASSKLHIVDLSDYAQQSKADHPRSNLRTAVRHSLGMKSDAWQSLLGFWVATRMFIQPGESFLQNLAIARQLAPRLIKHMRTLDVSAWIGINDYMALIVKSAIENSPHFASPAIIGFDNSLEAQIAGLTSYDFGWERIGFQAVECLIRPDRSIKADKNSDIKITGRVIERQSTAG